mgnify:CR=1 FL=1
MLSISTNAFERSDTDFWVIIYNKYHHGYGMIRMRIYEIQESTCTWCPSSHDMSIMKMNVSKALDDLGYRSGSASTCTDKHIMRQLAHSRLAEFIQSFDCLLLLSDPDKMRILFWSTQCKQIEDINCPRDLF